MNIKFSIITVCYNAAATIRQTMDSVLSQTHRDIEYIVVDGKSTDGTVDILESCRDPRLTYISERDSGVYNAMNKGLGLATGDYLIFLGADDTFLDPDVLSSVARTVQDRQAVLYGDVMLKNRRKIYRGEFTRWTWGHQNICHQSIFYPRTVYQAYTYDETFRTVADWDYNLRLIRDGIPFRYIGRVICTFNDSDGLSSSTKDTAFLKIRKKAVCQAVGPLPYYWGILCRIKRRLLNQKY